MSIIKEFNVKALHNHKIMVEIFDSAFEVIKVAKTRKIIDKRFSNMEKKELKEDWHGVKTYDEALHLMETGYQPTVEEFKKTIQVNFSEQVKRVAFKNDVVGYAPIVPLALLNVPQSMQNSCIKPMKEKIIDIYYDLSATGAYNADKFIEVGSKLLSAIIELEAQGYKFNIYAVQSGYDRRSSDVLCIKVKSSNTPFNLRRISFPLTHPAFLRVIGFDWNSKTPRGKYRDGYGKPFGGVFNQDELTNAFTEMFGKKCVFFSCEKIIGKGKDYLKEVLVSSK